eukprot:114543_1
MIPLINAKMMVSVNVTHAMLVRARTADTYVMDWTSVLRDVQIARSVGWIICGITTGYAKGIVCTESVIMIRIASTNTRCRSISVIRHRLITGSVLTSFDYWQCAYDDPNTYCSNDTDCSSTEVCHWGQCVADCTTQSNGRWCGNRYGDSYSCNPNDGHCWERPCDIALNDCPSDYVCEEEYGWTRCVVACVNDTDCAYTPNGYYDTSYKCQDDGLCERDSCDAGTCTDSGYVCNGLDECVTGCSNSTQCRMDHMWDHNWICEGYCVYRGCTTDNDCDVGSMCNTTVADKWECAYNRCGWDGDCAESVIMIRIASKHGYDESFKCQASGLCERDPCTQSSDCPESEYTCSQYDECVPGCQNNTVCASSHGWDWDWKCGDNNYCVYRACYNDTDCYHQYAMPEYICNMTSFDYWQCAYDDPNTY